MKKTIASLLCIILILTSLAFNVSAVTDEEVVPFVVDFVVTTEIDDLAIDENATRATGLINSYSLSLTKSGTKLHLSGFTYGSTDVVKCGFKDLTIQRRKSSAYDWEDCFEFGNVYRDATAASLETTVSVAAGYQYRLSCKHYAKKNILSVQTVSNTSNIVTVS